MYASIAYVFLACKMLWRVLIIILKHSWAYATSNELWKVVSSRWASDIRITGVIWKLSRFQKTDDFLCLFLRAVHLPVSTDKKLSCSWHVEWRGMRLCDMTPAIRKRILQPTSDCQTVDTKYSTSPQHLPVRLSTKQQSVKLDYTKGDMKVRGWRRSQEEITISGAECTCTVLDGSVSKESRLSFPHIKKFVRMTFWIPKPRDHFIHLQYTCIWIRSQFTLARGASDHVILR